LIDQGPGANPDAIGRTVSAAFGAPRATVGGGGPRRPPPTVFVFAAFVFGCRSYLWRRSCSWPRPPTGR